MRARIVLSGEVTKSSVIRSNSVLQRSVIIVYVRGSTASVRLMCQPMLRVLLAVD